MTSALRNAADAFIDDLGTVITDLANSVDAPATDPTGRPFDVQTLRRDVAVDAYNLSCAFIDCDGRHTDDQIWGLIQTFAPRLDNNLAGATPAHIRSQGMLAGKSIWIDEPSALFETLAAADRKSGTSHARTYYLRSMAVAHAVAALDAHTSAAELDALERFRSMLVRRLRQVTEAQTKVDSSRPATVGAGETESDEPPELPELPPLRPIDELFDELDELIGLVDVKREVKLVVNLIQVQNLRRERDLPIVDATRHLVFTGNPGTGKTTVARLLAEIYRTLGVVEHGHLVETDRSGLVVGYIGQTATRVTEVFDRANHGVLLVDEAYALARGGAKDFGREAIDTMVKLIEDRRDTIVVIVAGYTDEMAEFIATNPGLESRFPKTIDFPDYSTDELIAIFGLRAKAGEYTPDEEASAKIRAWLDAQPRDKGFGNGRLARNLLEEAMGRQAMRIVTIDDPTDEQLTTLTADDIPLPFGGDNQDPLGGDNQDPLGGDNPPPG